MTSLGWKRLLGLLGALGMGAAGVGLTHVSTPNCGVRVLERWSYPYLATIAVLVVVSLAVVTISIASSEQKARLIGQGLLVAGIGGAIALGALDAALRLTKPPLVQKQPFHVNHDRLGYVMAPRMRFEFSLATGEYDEVFYTNEEGFIDRPDEHGRPPDSIRIMFLGDSFLRGAEVATEDNMSARVVEMLEAATGKPYQAKNLGIGSYSPLRYYIEYLVFAPEFDPDIVVTVLFVGNDFIDTAHLYLGNQVVFDEDGNPTGILPALDEETNTYWVNAFDGRQPVSEVRKRLMPEDRWRRGLPSVVQTLVKDPVCERLAYRLFEPQSVDPNAFQYEPVDDGSTLACTGLSGELKEPCVNYALRNESLVRNNHDAIFKDAYTELDMADMEYSLDALRRLQRAAASDGREFVLVVLPVDHQVAGQGEGAKPRRGLQPGEIIASTAPQDLLRDFCAAEGMDCIDMLPSLRAHSDEKLFWHVDGHLTPRGHELVAEAIADYIVTHFAESEQS